MSEPALALHCRMRDPAGAVVLVGHLVAAGPCRLEVRSVSAQGRVRFSSTILPGPVTERYSALGGLVVDAAVCGPVDVERTELRLLEEKD